MQKVSKQSLAMIALSILLAISIALTFTLATLSDTKTAKGTITFNGTVALELGAGFTSGSRGYSFTLTAAANGAISIPDNLTIGLTSSSSNAHIKIAITKGSEKNASAVTLAAKTTGLSTLYNASGTTFTSKNKIAKGTSEKLSNLITLSAAMDNLSDDSTVTITLKIDANVSSTFA